MDQLHGSKWGPAGEVRADECDQDVMAKQAPPERKRDG